MTSEASEKQGINIGNCMPALSFFFPHEDGLSPLCFSVSSSGLCNVKLNFETVSPVAFLKSRCVQRYIKMQSFILRWHNAIYYISDRIF